MKLPDLEFNFDELNEPNMLVKLSQQTLRIPWKKHTGRTFIGSACAHVQKIQLLATTCMSKIGQRTCISGSFSL